MKYLRTALVISALITVAACGGAEDRKAAHMDKGQALFDAGQRCQGRFTGLCGRFRFDGWRFAVSAGFFRGRFQAFSSALR